MRDREAGVALITALLLVFLATVAAVEAVYRFQLTMNRSSVVLGQRQAWYFALGGEAWAMEILRRDHKESEVDHPKEAWARPKRTLPIQGGTLSSNIEDLQGRLNLNGLLDENGKALDAKVDQLLRLLRALAIEPEVGAAIVDWIDADIDPRPDGAESSDYLLRTPPYVAANVAMADPSELRQVRSITAEIYDKLLPHVATLPGATTVNVNTATVPVLMSLADDIDAASAAALQDGVGEKGYASVEAFLAHESLAGVQPPLDPAGLAVASQYFRVQTSVTTDYGQLSLTSVLEHAGEEAPQVIVRSVGGS